MKVYQSKYPKIAGRKYIDVERRARDIHKRIERRTKRTPYVKSAYFDGDKVFVNLYWTHLNQKPRADRKRRLKLYEAAIDLIENSRSSPHVRLNPNGRNETVYRFAGVTKDGELFFVQIKENARRQKYFMSSFSMN